MPELLREREPPPPLGVVPFAGLQRNLLGLTPALHVTQPERNGTTGFAWYAREPPIESGAVPQLAFGERLPSQLPPTE